jgi:hypothetical protein
MREKERERVNVCYSSCSINILNEIFLLSHSPLIKLNFGIFVYIQGAHCLYQIESERVNCSNIINIIENIL